MLKTMFSIPIHERTEVVIDQIANIQRFCPNSGIVLHISRGFDYNNSWHSREEFLSILKTFDNVFVNPTSLDTGFAEIVQTHVSNFKYVSSIAEFNYFSLMASNECFVRDMHCPMPSWFDISTDAIPIEQKTNWDWYKRAKADNYLDQILKHFGASKDAIMMSQIEGSTYRKELFDAIAHLIDRFYNFALIAKTDRIVYPREEVFFPTLAYLLDNNVRDYRNCFTFMRWGTNLVVPREDVNLISQGNHPAKYSVKRIRRHFDDPIRVYIGTAVGNYRWKSLEVARSRCLKKFVSLFNLVADRRRIFVGSPETEQFLREYFRINQRETFIPLVIKNNVVQIDNILTSMQKREGVHILCTPLYPMLQDALVRMGFREGLDFIDGSFLIGQ